MDWVWQSSLVEGDFGNGLLLRQSLTEGDFWARRRGCWTLYRGHGRADAIDYEQVVAVSEAAGRFTLPEHARHEAGRDYFYAARRVAPSGREEQGTMAVVRLSLDEAGRRRLPRPNAVCLLRGEQVAEGRVRVSWWYWPLGQEAAPVRFAVFGDGGSGVMDYEHVLAEVAYTGPHEYESDSSAYADGITARFGVRAVSGAGMDDGSMATVGVTITRSGPDGLEGLIARMEL